MTAKFGPDKPQFPLEPLHVYYISSNTPTTTSCSLIKRTSLAKQKPLQELFNPGNAPRIPGFCIHPPAQMLTFSNPHLLSKHLSPPSFKNLDFPPSKQYPSHGPRLCLDRARIIPCNFLKKKKISHARSTYRVVKDLIIDSLRFLAQGSEIGFCKSPLFNTPN